MSQTWMGILTVPFRYGWEQFLNWTRPWIMQIYHKEISDAITENDKDLSVERIDSSDIEENDCVDGRKQLRSNSLPIYTWNDKENALYAHNLVRGLHGVDGLLWDENLASEAQCWAVELAQTGTPRHSSFIAKDGSLYGECLFCVAGNVTSFHRVHDAVFEWYKEVEDYDFDRGGPKSHKEFRHFTQIIWNDTKRVGVGCAINEQLGKIVIVARYTPNGNVTKMYAKKVKKQTGKGSSSVYVPNREHLISPKDSKPSPRRYR